MRIISLFSDGLLTLSEFVSQYDFFFCFFKELFFRYFGGETVVADDDGREDTFALIGRLDDADFAAKLAAFVSEVLRIKAAAKG